MIKISLGFVIIFSTKPFGFDHMSVLSVSLLVNKGLIVSRSLWSSSLMLTITKLFLLSSLSCVLKDFLLGFSSVTDVPCFFFYIPDNLLFFANSSLSCLREFFNSLISFCMRVNSLRNSSLWVVMPSVCQKGYSWWLC